ncbi:CRAL/TRIO domain-containing protein [Thelephora ganbajun]|uniref:CRAL/TRIO domain-containing protein n=1 Tax=Thelephora ganbajun TaxID=370292 RepID=A0ACB6Z9B3_THEGA|nr:CRAL/TRIO domain-containing protein [Thelephora ganbajun]
MRQEIKDKKTETTEPEPEEPQNPLTKKFTEAEWEALKELRTKLPYIFETSFPEKENKLSPIILWGVPIDPSNPVGDARVSVVLVKFLRARELNVENATNMMISTLKWREEFKTDEVVTEEFPQDLFGSVGHVFGKDKDGRPVTYNIYGGDKDIAAVFADVPKFIRWRVQLMERGITLIDFTNVDSMVQVHDYEGVGLRSRDANSKAAASQASKIFQDYYPEFLSKKFFINVPTFMTWIFWLFKPLISANTLAKMNVVGSGTATISEALLPVVDARELPKRYGGEAEAF